MNTVMRRRPAAGSFLLAACLFAAAAPFPEAAMAMNLESVFHGGAMIPTKYTCQGDDQSPRLDWSGVPDKARSLVLIVDDPDAPDPEAPKTTWVHWVVYNLPAEAGGLPESATAASLPDGARQGRNSWDKTEYGGPCPPIGTHRYFFKLYALDTRLDFDAAPDKDAVEAAMRGHVVARADLMGRYHKSP